MISKRMPIYKCHKEVSALKIKEIDTGWLQKSNPYGGGACIIPEDMSYGTFTVSKEYMEKHNPQKGGYYVVYKDGYESYSPAEPFEEGYVLKGEERILDAPAKYNLAQIFAELKFGRPAGDQRFLDKCINELESGGALNHVSTPSDPHHRLRIGLGTFGEATEAAKQGKKVARKGWNGSGMYAYIVPAASYPAQTEAARQQFGDMVPYRAYWALKTAQNDVATWAPSGSDSLAEDWMIVEGEQKPIEENDFIGRLIIERHELNEKREKLQSFLSNPNTEQIVGDFQYVRLKAQLEVMTSYAAILEERISFLRGDNVSSGN